MSVRAKFKVQRIERTAYTRSIGKEIQSTELQTIVLVPVYGGGNPEHENTKFWQATPSGEIKLGTINADAAAQFELDKEYYIDFTRAE